MKAPDSAPLPWKSHGPEVRDAEVGWVCGYARDEVAAYIAYLSTLPARLEAAEGALRELVESAPGQHEDRCGWCAAREALRRYDRLSQGEPNVQRSTQPKGESK